jgi:hypothetical protein
MVEVYMPQSADGFEFCYPERQEDFETLNVTIDGTPRKGTWHSPPMHLIREDEGKRLAESDSPWLGSHALIFRRQTLGELESLLLSYGELLPIACSEPDLVIFNATRVLDALDERASDILRFSDGRIMRITRYAFCPDIVAGVDIFKIPNFRVSPTYVSERFVKRVKAAGLRGLVFYKVWSASCESHPEEQG